jgi:Flp pilus assembly pilin Flp
MMKNNRGASLLEYGLLSGLVGVISITAVLATGGEVKSVFSTSGGALANAISGEGATDGVGSEDPTTPSNYVVNGDASMGTDHWSFPASALITQNEDGNSYFTLGNGTPDPVLATQTVDFPIPESMWDDIDEGYVRMDGSFRGRRISTADLGAVSAFGMNSEGVDVSSLQLGFGDPGSWHVSLGSERLAPGVRSIRTRMERGYADNPMDFDDIEITLVVTR